MLDKDRSATAWTWPGVVCKRPAKRVARQCLVKDSRFVNTIGVLETPFPERYGEAIRLLESLRQRR